ncbi:MAG: hypothetical protein FWH48_00900 [Oscillospiraceae bacterium]|nr:hypothetical protein [Oscillospiraceae bacterium]
MNEKKTGSDLANPRALFALKIVTMSFAILACVVVATAMLTRWIMDLNSKIKESSSKFSRAAARLEKFRKERIKHILKQRRAQLKEEKASKKRKLGELSDAESETDELLELDELEELEELEDGI